MPREGRTGVEAATPAMQRGRIAVSGGEASADAASASEDAAAVAESEAEAACAWGGMAGVRSRSVIRGG